MTSVAKVDTPTVSPTNLIIKNNKRESDKKVDEVASSSIKANNTNAEASQSKSSRKKGRKKLAKKEQDDKSKTDSKIDAIVSSSPTFPSSTVSIPKPTKQTKDEEKAQVNKKRDTNEDALVFYPNLSSPNCVMPSLAKTLKEVHRELAPPSRSAAEADAAQEEAFAARQNYQMLLESLARQIPGFQVPK